MHLSYPDTRQTRNAMIISSLSLVRVLASTILIRLDLCANAKFRPLGDHDVRAIYALGTILTLTLGFTSSRVPDDNNKRAHLFVFDGSASGAASSVKNAAELSFP